MGRTFIQATLTASLSRHNSDNDQIDNALWRSLMERIRCLVTEPQYESLGIMFDARDDDL